MKGFELQVFQLNTSGTGTIKDVLGGPIKIYFLIFEFKIDFMEKPKPGNFWDVFLFEFNVNSNGARRIGLMKKNPEIKSRDTAPL